VLIFAAMRLEAKALTRALDAAALAARPSRPCPAAPPESGSPASERIRVEVHTIGPGAVRMPAFRSSDIAVIMAGLAGGLDPALRVGDVVIDAPEDVLPSAAIPAGCRRGTIHTSKAVVTTPQGKTELFAKTGALAVDMENDIVRRAAEAAGLPFIGIRAISDEANETLDADMLGLIDKLGRIRPVAVAALLMRRPTSVMALCRLGGNTRLAVRNVTDTVVQVHGNLAINLKPR